MIVQIYAFTRIEDALAAARAGVDQIGFVAGDYGLVHGELSFAQARALVEALPPTVRKVALTMSTDVKEILRMAQYVQPDIIHISTDLEEVGIKAMQQLRQNLPDDVGLMKAIPVVDESSVAQAVAFSDVSDLLLLDTKINGLPGVGASGQTHDWSISRKIVKASLVPVILAGGLTPENVGEAILAVHPWGVDSNTGTNLPGDPVQKDMQRVADFVTAARKTER